ncbi:hypothetical protein BH11PSE11_BH11PSE11_19230 [soil metagenome]
MHPEVLIVREDQGYRVLHGHLHLASLLAQSEEAEVLAVSEGKKKVVKTRSGILVDDVTQPIPLLKH